ncbi:heat shock protein HtpX [Caldalkalibacillus uzonensis]|uniref:Protease HtpX homolog n=1 Tax=Caldalkalibacillus uzonensis TaxID=353224 RepID=A0ABU0CV30_9BACI|nr:zinc metalloprotease HtpX [Caldalkalibacillus uzonensis]MDQ0340285.1 heat shock protein HtpX [Caldalkalibacillus uzonensis]
MLFKQIEQNKRRTIFLMLLFGALVLGIGAAVGLLLTGDYLSGIILAAIILGFYLPITYLSATSQVLSMAGAKEISKADHPMLYNIVEEMALAARIPMPKVYIIPDEAPNAFATGIKPENGAVAFTTGLLKRLNREELTGLAAHEIAHIRNYDIRLMTISIALVGVIIFIADIGSRMLFYERGKRNNKSHPALYIVALLLIILAPLAAQFVHFAVSRNREYLADASAVELTRNPLGLKNALIKISQSGLDVKRANEATAAMYIVHPLAQKRRRKYKVHWFATHPPIESRIERLEQM